MAEQGRSKINSVNPRLGLFRGRYSPVMWNTNWVICPAEIIQHYEKRKEEWIKRGKDLIKEKKEAQAEKPKTSNY